MPLDTFTQAYIEAALWSSTDSNDHPLDRGCYELAPQTRARMIADCAKFQAENDLSEGTEERAGHDFWLTRCGHGCGFWDGDWPETGDTLTAAAKAFGNVDLYVGDDGLIYSL